MGAPGQFALIFAVGFAFGDADEAGTAEHGQPGQKQGPQREAGLVLVEQFARHGQPPAFGELIGGHVFVPHVDRHGGSLGFLLALGTP